MPKTYFKKIIKIRPEDTFQFHSLIQKSDKENQMIKLFYKQLQNYVDKKNIFKLKSLFLYFKFFAIKAK